MEAGLLSAILGLVTVQGETAMLDLDLQKIAGFWKEVGVASSQNLVLKTPKRLEALFLTLSGHELLVKAAYYSSGSCETENIVGSEIDMSGTFVFPARSLEDEYGPGFWRFRELTADTGLYLVARHGRCAKLLKEVSLAPVC
ncbi:epididymal-specific lipocalin-8 isoform X4 [Vulpes lagopus]|uniref:epididymal-specific lipocalin-8 isoform X4 n=1 Tax=Vulpes lagopus TaxID=494514 RepID=UPI001BC98B03|nr:epididymal-specific lipocalin-8 isoform X4 [Vulpes lagopus]